MAALLADATPGGPDYVARAIAIAGVILTLLKIFWDIFAWRSQGILNLGFDVVANEHNHVEVRVTNRGRVPVFVQKAVLAYNLGGQVLFVDLAKQTDPDHDTKLEVGGQSLLLRSTFPAETRMQIRLGFVENPHFPYISVRSEAGELLCIGNGVVQPVLRQTFNLHVFNEASPT